MHTHHAWNWGMSTKDAGWDPWCVIITGFGRGMWCGSSSGSGTHLIGAEKVEERGLDEKGGQFLALMSAGRSTGDLGKDLLAPPPSSSSWARVELECATLLQSTWRCLEGWYEFREGEWLQKWHQKQIHSSDLRSWKEYLTWNDRWHNYTLAGVCNLIDIISRSCL